MQCPSSPFRSLHPSLRGGVGAGGGVAGAGCGSAPASAAPKKAGWARGRRWALWAPRKGGCRRGVPFRARRAPRGRSPAITKALSGLGWAAPAPPIPPSRPDPPDPRCPAGCAGPGARPCWHSLIHPSALLGALFATWRAPLGRRGQARGAGERDRGIPGFWPPGLRPAAVGGEQLRGGDAPAHSCREGGRGREGEKGAAARRSRAAGRVPGRGQRREGRAGLSAHVPWKILCPAPLGDRMSRAGRGARREPQSGEK